MAAVSAVMSFQADKSKEHAGDLDATQVAERDDSNEIKSATIRMI